MCADVPYPIFNADAIYHFDLLQHLKRGQLIDNNTKLAISGRLALAPVVRISALDKAHPMAHLLARYPQIFSPSAPIGTRAAGVFHTLQTTGDPLAQKAKRLTPEKLRAVRQQFSI
uniref:Uncharacterized protein n=1 Tax=Trichogramma kaykai TaxID=54128 RepID=A0ABD2WAL5_9HYME